MIFTSFQYAAFLAAVIVLNWALPPRARPALLLVASYVFYASWSIPAVSILIAATLVAWLGALGMGRLTGAARRNLAVVSVAAATSTLGIFKLLVVIGHQNDIASSFVVPVGLSFFCFQAISYLVDVFRREIEPNPSLVDVALYLAFFPHLLAGPIVRARKLIPAFHNTPSRPDPVQCSEGAELILVGVFKKVALADPIYALSTSPITHPATAGSATMVTSLVALLLAGYFDVTGYVDIARGSAKLLGIDMQRNSLLPLLRSTGYGDFWRRWQLTIMMWFRDYVYLPVRGKDGKPWRENAALFTTFFVLGIWHGFTSGWALWGVVSGVIIIVERTVQTRRSARRRAQTLEARRLRSRAALPKPPSAVVSLAIALALVALSFPLIANDSTGKTLDIYRALITPTGGVAYSWDLFALVVTGIIALFVLDHREQRRERHAGRPDPAPVLRAAAFGTMVLGIIVFSGPKPQTFVYFHF